MLRTLSYYELKNRAGVVGQHRLGPRDMVELGVHRRQGEVKLAVRRKATDPMSAVLLKTRRSCCPLAITSAGTLDRPNLWETDRRTFHLGTAFPMPRQGRKSAVRLQKMPRRFHSSRSRWRSDRIEHAKSSPTTSRIIQRTLSGTRNT
ncbi:MAG TPA: hypothetical protein VEF72_10945 [Mycobacterium sp.]|nr:hypothetical protein [Mycobacterium sp.]